ncbi:MAG: hypothetical protein WDW19_02380 [Neisseriaceae bacterium]
MRQPQFNRLNSHQRGYILIVVLAILVLISLLITATYIVTATSLKNSAHEMDHRYALGLAEKASQIASREISQQFADPDNDIIPPVTSLKAGTPILRQLAEESAALVTLDGKKWPQSFTADCAGRNGHKGFCSTSFMQVDSAGQQLDRPPLPPVYERKNVFNAYEGKSCGNAVTISTAQLPQNSARPPCYVVEFLGIPADSRTLTYRITVVAWGRDPHTVVKLESTYEMNYD